MHVRPYTEDDAGAISAILDATYGGDPRLHALFADSHRLALEPPSRGTLVAELDGEVVGAGTIYHGAFHPLRTQLSLDVAPAHRRRGIGTALLRELRELADRPLRTRGLFTIEGGVPFLRHHGFEELAQHFEGRFDPGDVLAKLPPPRLDDTPSRDEAAEFFARWYEQAHHWDPPAPIPLDTARGMFCGDAALPGSLVGVRREGRLFAAANLIRPPGYDPGDEVYLVWVGATGDDAKAALQVVAACIRFAHDAGKQVRFELDGTNIPVWSALDRLGVLGEPELATFGEELR